MPQLLEMSSTAWSYNTLEEACNAVQPAGFITLDQFAAEVQRDDACHQTRRLAATIDNNHSSALAPHLDPIANLKMNSMLNGLAAPAAQLPNGQMRTASATITDHQVVHEQEITQMLREAGISAIQPDYRLNSDTTRRSCLVGNEPMRVAGLTDVFIDDSFFVIDESTAVSVSSEEDSQAGLSQTKQISPAGVNSSREPQERESALLSAPARFVFMLFILYITFQLLILYCLIF